MSRATTTRSAPTDFTKIANPTPSAWAISTLS